jgi:hypothetical protein
MRDIADITTATALHSTNGSAMTDFGNGVTKMGRVQASRIPLEMSVRTTTSRPQSEKHTFGEREALH